MIPISFKTVPEPPVDGTQFIAIWNHDSRLWGNTYRHNKGGFERYSPVSDNWHRVQSMEFSGSNLYLVADNPIAH